MDEVQTLLAELRSIHREVAPAVFELDRIEPAAPETIEAFEERLGVKLADDHRAFLLANDLVHSFDGNFRCLTLDGAISAWETMTGLLESGIFDDGR